MATSPREALDQLRREARDGTLAGFCREIGVELLVAFGSAVNLDWPVPPRDLDLAVLMVPPADVLTVINELIDHLRLDEIDLMDLARAGDVARAQALGRGELLYEATPGTFAERQMFALAQTADTAWLRRIELEMMAR
jgi:Polymerase beta, Nucleotidyltransferase